MAQANEVVNTPHKIINKGTGAGGSNTNFYGKKFEEKTNNTQRLKEMSFIKLPTKYNCLTKSFTDKTITFVTQSGFKKYMKDKYQINNFDRYPDEAYVIDYHNGKKIIIKILEKKAQNVEGSVETKLWASPALKREYEIKLKKNKLEHFEVSYGLCLSNFLKEKMTSNEEKYEILNEILNENNIDILFGDDDNYFNTLDMWINN